jgi:hypothetical protein
MIVRRRWLWRGAVLILVAALVGVLTVNAMPRPLPPELRFLWDLHPEVIDTPKHVGCSTSEEVYPSQTLRLQMDFSQFQSLLRKNLENRPEWRLSPRDDGGNLLAEKLPILSRPDNNLPSIELITTGSAASKDQEVVITDYRKPYNPFARWVIRLRGK